MFLQSSDSVSASSQFENWPVSNIPKRGNQCCKNTLAIPDQDFITIKSWPEVLHEDQNELGFRRANMEIQLCIELQSIKLNFELQSCDLSSSKGLQTKHIAL